MDHFFESTNVVVHYVYNITDTQLSLYKIDIDDGAGAQDFINSVYPVNIELFHLVDMSLLEKVEHMNKELKVYFDINIGDIENTVDVEVDSISLEDNLVLAGSYVGMNSSNF